MAEILIEHIEWAVKYAHVWGFLIVFILMTIESSFIPFPSEVVMIPAGFMAARGELTFAQPQIDMAIVFLCGLSGSLAGAYINYYLAMRLGRPFLYRYGRYFLIKPGVLARAEEIFLRYGEITTFICRLLPAIRQLISLPAGISRMPLSRFSLFTGLGAGIWSIILLGIGYYFGSMFIDMSYVEIVHKGKSIIKDHFIWIIVFIVLLIAVYGLIHHKVMKTEENKPVLKDQSRENIL
ncbi:MAG: DedA family protein [Deltaproteobacteria bacterium]|nr:DedA family protein [Deltaproteobacteria bacterium]